MPNQVIKGIPEFTTDESQGGIQDIHAPQTTPNSGVESTETPVEQEKETPTDPSTENEPATSEETQGSDNTSNLQEQYSQLRNAITGLEKTKSDLIGELRDIRGQRRDAKQAEIDEVQEKIDKLEDVNPDDVSLVDRILHAKGYVPKQDMQRMLGESKKQDEIANFLKEYPEYSEEGDPDRVRFNQLIQEVSLYKEPSNPTLWGVILRRAHKAIAPVQKVASDRTIAIKKRQAEIAGVGTGGGQRSSSVKPFSERTRLLFEHGGWSEEEIKEMEERSSQ